MNTGCEPCDVYVNKTRTARKEHTCMACHEIILKGHKYTIVNKIYDGHAYTIKRCSRCEKIHSHLVTRMRNDPYEYGDSWPAERLNCGESYQDVWNEDPPDDIAALAFALPEEINHE